MSDLFSHWSRKNPSKRFHGGMRRTLTVSLETGDKASIPAGLSSALCQALLSTLLMKSAVTAGREQEKEGKEEEKRKEKIPSCPYARPGLPQALPARGCRRPAAPAL